MNKNTINFLEKELNAVSSRPTHLTAEWEEICVVVDSGAGQTVIGRDTLPLCPLESSEDSRAGVQYEVANGVTIKAAGQKKFAIRTQDGATQISVCPGHRRQQ